MADGTNVYPTLPADPRTRHCAVRPVPDCQDLAPKYLFKKGNYESAAPSFRSPQFYVKIQESKTKRRVEIA